MDTGQDAFIRKTRTPSDTMEEERFRTLNYSTLQDAFRRFRKRDSAMGRALLIVEINLDLSIFDSPYCANNSAFCRDKSRPTNIWLTVLRKQLCFLSR
ncbi:hypothetical protein CKO50_21780 [Pseudoalteromonas sp. HM-SA03]|nr:hypothetical protein CKO50_21780 [Pseudoalteromonas sp. HM-SA03]